MKNINEKKIVIISCLITGLVSGFISIGSNETIFSSKSIYASEDNKEKIPTLTNEDYELLETQKEEDKDIYSVLLKKDFNTDELISLYEIFENEYDSNLEIHLFNNSEDTDPITKISSTGDNSISIKQYYKLNLGSNASPKEYEVLSVETENDETFIECELPNVDNEVDALKYIRYIGTNIRNSSSENLGKLNITAYTDTDKKNSWQYDGNYKDTIIKESIISLDK